MSEYTEALDRLYTNEEQAMTELCNRLLDGASDRWDDDVADIAILERFCDYYGELDREIDEARAEDDYEDTARIVFVWDPERGKLVRESEAVSR